jgi:hypothetical protein
MLLICSKSAEDAARFANVLKAAKVNNMVSVGLAAMAALPEATVVLQFSPFLERLQITIEDSCDVHRHEHKLSPQACTAVEAALA